MKRVKKKHLPYLNFGNCGTGKSLKIKKKKFSVNDKVLDDCGCVLRIKKVGWKYYTVRNTKLPVSSFVVTVRKGKATKVKHIKNENFDYTIEIKDLNKRGRKI